MSISLRFEIDFQTPPSDLSGQWRVPQPNARSDSNSIDPYDIGERQYSPQNENRNNAYAQTPNDAQALMDFVTMLMAILAQFIAAASQSPSSSDDEPASSGRSPRKATANNGDDEINGKSPPAFVARTEQPGDITDDLPPTDSSSPPTGSKAVSPASGQTVSTGTGTGHFFNVTNNTDRAQTFAFSSNSSNTSGYSNNINAVMTLQPGQTGTFEAGDDVPGIRINTSGPNGETNGNETLYEDTIETNPMGGGIVHNPDVSNVAGKLSYDGRPQLVTVSDGSRTIGDGTETGVYDYDVEDTDPNRATNPMNMALNPASTYDIVFSDG